MRAVVTVAPGEPPRVTDHPDPAPPAGHAVVRMLAAGLNPVDLAIAAGRFYMPVPDLPRVAGAEAVGEVVSSAVHPAGTRVWCLQPTGCFAERFTAPDEALVPLPAGTDPVLAASLGIAGLAGWAPVHSRGGVRPGETVVVLGATGVAGQVAVQAAVAAGAAAVVAVGRNPDAPAEATALGATAVVRMIASTDLTGELRHACPHGADVVVDALWGDPLVATLPVLASNGRVVQVGSAAAPSAAIVAGPLRGGRIDIRGFSVFSEARDELARQYLALLAAAGTGGVRVRTVVMPLADAADAFARQAAGTGGVKLVLVP